MKYLTQIDFQGVEQRGLPGFKLSNSYVGNQATIGDIISLLLPILFTFAGLLLLLYLLFGGISLMTSGGDPKAVASAKGKITNAFIGFILVFVSYWVVKLIGIIFQLDAIKNIFV